MIYLSSLSLSFSYPAVHSRYSNGLAHAWSLRSKAERDRCSWRHSLWAATLEADDSWVLPSASAIGASYGANDIVELRLASQRDPGGDTMRPGSADRGPSSGGGSGLRAKGSRGSVGADEDECLVIGRCSGGALVVWDVLGRQLLVSVSPPYANSVVPRGIRALPSPPQMPLSNLLVTSPSPAAAGRRWASGPLLVLAEVSASDETAQVELPRPECRRGRGALPAGAEGGGICSANSARDPRSCLAAIALHGGDCVDFLPGPDLSCLHSPWGSTGAGTSAAACLVVGVPGLLPPPSPLPTAPVSVSCLASLAGLVAIGLSSGQASHSVCVTTQQP